MIVRKMPALLSEYSRDPVIQRNQTFIDDFKKKFVSINAQLYRGVSREPLSPVDEDKDYAEIIASVRFAELINEDRNEWLFEDAQGDYNSELILDLEQASEIFKYLQRPEFYEIIAVAREEFGTEYEQLGFDIADWAGDHFSIICDSLIMPRWHPPEPEDWNELSKYALHLNQHLLFDNFADAQKFRDCYLSKRWAEEEAYPGEFCIMQIAIPKNYENSRQLPR